MTTPTIRTATAAEVEPTIAAMVLAFSADPPARWGYPDPPQYLIHYPNFVKAFGGQAFLKTHRRRAEIRSHRATRPRRSPEPNRYVLPRP